VSISERRGQSQAPYTSARVEAKDAPHRTICSDPLAHAANSLGEVMGGLKTMSSCGAFIGAALTDDDAVARRRVVKKALRSMFLDFESEILLIM